MLKQLVSFIFSLLVFFSSTGILRDTAHAFEHQGGEELFISADEACAENTRADCHHQTHIISKLHECTFHFFYNLQSIFLPGTALHLPNYVPEVKYFSFYFSEGYRGFQPNFGRSRAPPVKI